MHARVASDLRLAQRAANKPNHARLVEARDHERRAAEGGLNLVVAQLTRRGEPSAPSEPSTVCVVPSAAITRSATLEAYLRAPPAVVQLAHGDAPLLRRRTDGDAVHVAREVVREAAGDGGRRNPLHAELGRLPAHSTSIDAGDRLGSTWPKERSEALREIEVGLLLLRDLAPQRKACSPRS